jgi:hypothetical protein
VLEAEERQLTGAEALAVEAERRTADLRRLLHDASAASRKRSWPCWWWGSGWTSGHGCSRSRCGARRRCRAGRRERRRRGTCAGRTRREHTTAGGVAPGPLHRAPRAESPPWRGAATSGRRVRAYRVW